MRYLVIDGSNLICRWWYANVKPGMTQKEATGLVLNKASARIKRWVSEYRADKVIICFDRKTSSLRRREIYPDYKVSRLVSNNETKIPGMKESISIFEKLLMLTSDYEIRADNNREADDLPGDFIEEGNEYVLISADLDWFRYVSNNVRLFDYKTEYSGESCHHNKTACKPSQLVNYKILYGDPSDGVKPLKKNVTTFQKSSLLNTSKNELSKFLNVSINDINILETIYCRDCDTTSLEIYQGIVDIEKANLFLIKEDIDEIVVPYRKNRDIRNLVGL